MGRKTVAILFGGCSEEHPVSVKSAREIAAHIDSEKYEAVYIGITRGGAWKLCAGPGPEWEREAGPTALISPDRGVRGLLLLEGDVCRTRHIDVVFPVLHGKTGEDGAIQGLLELSGLPYVGCDIPGSALCMDKALAYVVVRHAGIATPDFCILPENEAPAAEPFAYPVFVKPARSGSSFGVTKVERSEDLAAAVAAARAYDSKVLVEQAVAGREVGCAVLGSGADLTVGEVDYITLSHGFFRIHQESQPESGSENATVTVPAPLPPELRRHIQETAKAIYRALGCRGLARVDMFLRDSGEVVLNEVNTLPGFTSYSRYPRMMKAAGIGLTEVIDRCITLALAE